MTTATPPRKRMSTTAKIFLILLLLLTVVVAGFVWTAWRELNRIDPVAAPAQNHTVEVLTPSGASQGTAGNYMPPPGQTAASAAAGSDVPAAPPVAGNTPPRPPAGKPADPKPGTGGATAEQQEVPLTPINVPPKSANSGNKPADKPAARSKPNTPPANNPIDNLF